MFPNYIGRLRVSVEDLNSPDYQLVQAAYSTLFELWLRFSEDPKFVDDFMPVYEEHPNLAREFADHIDKLSVTQEKKTALLNSIKMLSPKSQTSEKDKKTTSQVIDSDAKNTVNTVNIEDQTPKVGKIKQQEGQFEFSISGSTAGIIAILISLSALVGGLSAGYNIRIGIIFALIFFTGAILLFIYSVLKPK